MRMIKNALIDFAVTFTIVGIMEAAIVVIEKVNYEKRKRREEEELKRSMGKLIIVPRRK